MLWFSQRHFVPSSDIGLLGLVFQRPLFDAARRGKALQGVV